MHPTTNLLMWLSFQPLLLFAIAAFEVGSLLCGLSSNIVMLIIARAIAGIGGGGITSMVIIVISGIISSNHTLRITAIHTQPTNVSFA